MGAKGNLPLKTIRSNIGYKYYGRYDETRQNPGPFARFPHAVLKLNIQCLTLNTSDVMSHIIS
jgi:hypothetical protein